MTISALPPIVKSVAVLTGIVVPCLVFGRVIMALPLVLAGRERAPGESI